MPIRKFLYIFTALLAVTGCDRNSTQGDDTSAEATASLPASGQAQVQTTAPDKATAPSDLRKNVPLPLGPGQSISGELSHPKPGVIGSADIKIGNYKSRSDGGLLFQLCQADNCTNGKSSLIGSTDNKNLQFPLEKPISVSAGQPLKWKITRDSATNAVAIWTYPLGKGATGIVGVDGSPVERAPRIVLNYSVQ
jgi:hypothetical protein